MRSRVVSERMASLTPWRSGRWPSIVGEVHARTSLTKAVATRSPGPDTRANWPEYDAALVKRGSLTVWMTEGLLRSIADVIEIDYTPSPDRATLSRRGVGLTILPNRVGRTEPPHLLIDSTGLKIYGEGEWLDQKHGIRWSSSLAQTTSRCRCWHA